MVSLVFERLLGKSENLRVEIVCVFYGKEGFESEMSSETRIYRFCIYSLIDFIYLEIKVNPTYLLHVKCGRVTSVIKLLK